MGAEVTGTAHTCPECGRDTPIRYYVRGIAYCARCSVRVAKWVPPLPCPVPGVDYDERDPR